MEAQEYATMAAFETSYWWYRGLHHTLADTLIRLGLPQAARLLDAGCGTGGALLHLGEHFTSTGGFDYSADAAPFWRQRGLDRCCLASINAMPYAGASFDAVLSVDVLESDAVDEAQAIRELCRVARPGAVVLFTVPAYRWLFSPQHHQAVHASRRYTRAEALRLLDGAPVEVVRATYLFGLLFPLIAVRRLFSRFFERAGADGPQSELRPLPKPINALFIGIMALETRLLRAVDLPFGSSILIIARKRA